MSENSSPDNNYITANVSNIHIVPFALLPTSSAVNHDMINHGLKGIVGNVTFFGTSAFVWATHSGIVDVVENDNTTSIQTRGLPIMGSLGLAMPRKRYAGMKRDDSSYTQLIGGSSDEDMILASGMACRLSEKSGYPIFVSLNVAGDNDNSRDHITSAPSHEHSEVNSFDTVRMTVVRIEREVTRILLLQQKAHAEPTDSSTTQPY